MENENMQLPGQYIIEVQTVKEIEDRMGETTYTASNKLKALKLKTGKRIHFFFRTNVQNNVEKIYHATFKNESLINWHHFTNHFKKIDDAKMEDFYMALYDEVIDNLGAQ